MRNIMAAAAAFSLAAAPVAAQAGTRANDIVPASASIARDAQPVTGASSLEGESAIAYAIFAGIIAIAVVFAITILDDDEDDAFSPG